MTQPILSFTERVRAVVRSIPRGKTMTYAEVARAAGSPRAARAVGNILSKNRNPKDVPCHRVIRADGGMGGYSLPGGTMRKRKILREEGAF